MPRESGENKVSYDQHFLYYNNFVLIPEIEYLQIYHIKADYHHSFEVISIL